MWVLALTVIISVDNKIFELDQKILIANIKKLKKYFGS